MKTAGLLYEDWRPGPCPVPAEDHQHGWTGTADAGRDDGGRGPAVRTGALRHSRTSASGCRRGRLLMCKPLAIVRYRPRCRAAAGRWSRPGWRRLRPASSGRPIGQGMYVKDSAGVAGRRRAQLLFRIVPAAYERCALGMGSHSPLESWAASSPSTSQPSACSTGCCTTATPGDKQRELPHARKPAAEGGATPLPLTAQRTRQGL